MNFFVRDAESLVPVEVKETDGATISLNNLIKKEKYEDIKYGIKLGNKNIVTPTFSPLFLVFRQP